MKIPIFKIRPNKHCLKLLIRYKIGYQSVKSWLNWLLISGFLDRDNIGIVFAIPITNSLRSIDKSAWTVMEFDMELKWATFEYMELEEWMNIIIFPNNVKNPLKWCYQISI